jgi:hypothetical protein
MEAVLWIALTVVVALGALACCCWAHHRREAAFWRDLCRDALDRHVEPRTAPPAAPADAPAPDKEETSTPPKKREGWPW